MAADPTPEFRFNDESGDKLGVEFKFEGDEFRFGEPAPVDD